MPCVDYRAIWRTNRTETALFLPPGYDAQVLRVVAVKHHTPTSQGEMILGLSANRKLSAVWKP
jgi:S-adenosylmethionine:tRNA-ribosyltransferase-isomerase (queuine synthetase)